MSNSTRNIIEKSVKKSFLDTFVKDYLMPPDKFKELVKDNCVEGEQLEIPVFKNLDDYLSRTQKDLVNSETITIDTAFPKELQLISLSLSPKYFYTFPEMDKNSGETRVEIILDLVKAANQYGVSMPLPEYRGNDYTHESGLNKEFLLEYFPDDGISIFKFIWTLISVPELQRSPEFIIRTWHNIDNNPEDVKDNLFLNVSKELLDDEQFISDSLNSGMNNYGHPLQYASKRIQKLYE